MAKIVADMEIEKVVMELPDTKTVRLQWPEGYGVDFLTGQFITVAWPDTPKYRRAYSLSSCALDRGHFEVTVKRDGKMGTRIVDWAKEGDVLTIIQPLGKFLPVYEPEKHLVCIAGGSGVTPFRGYVREATRRGLDTKITVLYSVRTTGDVIFNDEFRELEKENPNFEFKVTCTRLADDDPWEGRRGRIDADWIREQVGDLPDTVFYACGPTPLVEFAEDLMREGMGVDKKQMIVEKWG
jgi:Na+-transporting NADH:ubiquinone oxidoreductase subunit F